MDHQMMENDEIAQIIGALNLDQRQVIQARKDFLAFDDADIDRLRQLAPKLTWRSDAIIDAIYDHLLKFPETKKFLPNEAVIRRLKGMQKEYFSTLLAGPYDSAYVAGRVKIGLAHVRVDLKSELYLGTYCLYLRLVMDALCEEFGDAAPWYKPSAKSGKEVLANFQSFLKAVFFDIGLTIDSYIGPLLNRMEAEHRRMEFERNVFRDLTIRMEGSAQQTNLNVQTVATASEEMAASIKKISRSVQEASRVTSQAVRMAESTNNTIAKLGESSAEIGEVVKVITSIAQQTNLLALNATIEAARAGEAGKGFAVVANEVKELAKATAKATEEIGQKILTIQTDIRGAMGAIGEISKIVTQINEISTTIAGAVEEQTATTTEISRNVAEAAHGTSEVVRNISEVSAASKSAV